MKILDRYLIKGFLAPFGVCVAIFSILVLMGRFFDKMSIFNNYHARANDILAYLVLGLPFWLNLVLPVATLLALLFSLGQLHQRGEFTAFRGAGIPTSRLLTPYVTVGLVLSAVSLVGGMTILPELSFESRAVYRVRIKKGEVLNYRKDNVVAAGRDYRRFTIGWLDVDKNLLTDVVVDRFDRDSSWVETLSARRASYSEGGWLLEDGVRRVRDNDRPMGVREESFKTYRADIPEKPRDFVIEDKKPDDMTGRELRERIKRLRRLGASVYKEQVAWHLRIALPFANVVVIALGVPFALRGGSRGRTQNFSYAIGLAFLYWGVTSIGESFGVQGRVPAWAAAWVSNVLFTGVAVWLLRRQPIG